MTPAQSGHFQSVPVACRACANKLARRVAVLEKRVVKAAVESRKLLLYNREEGWESIRLMRSEADRILARRAKGRK